MEPNKLNPVPQAHTNSQANTDTSALDVLHDEGIDIVQGSGYSEENEFSTGSSASSLEILDESLVAPEPLIPVPVTTPKPVTQSIPVPRPPVAAPIQATRPVPMPPPQTFVQKPFVAAAPVMPRPIPVPPPVPKPISTPVPAPIPAPVQVATAPVEPASQTIPTPQPVAVPLPIPTPIPQPAPVEKTSLTRESANLIASLQEIPKSFTAKPPEPAPAPTPAPQPVPVAPAAPIPHPFNDPSIKQIRTFKSDAEEAVKFKNVSAVDIAVAEQKKREKSTPIEYNEPKTSHTGPLIISVMLLMLLLAGGWYYWFYTSQTVEIKQAPAIAIRTIIPYTKAGTITIDADSDPLILIGSKLVQANAGLGNIFALIPVGQATATEPVSLATILRDTSIPNRLLRSLDAPYMIGAYTYDTQSPFLILKNTFFQNAFSGMLEWEKNMRTDLLPLIQVAHTGTTGVQSIPGSFEDAIVSNIDTRVLKNEKGEIILLYAFADKDTIVVTTSQTTLKFILDRLLTVRTIQ